MKILVVDGQGGKIGKAIIEGLKKAVPNTSIYAIGTNSIATSTMIKAGADFAATGENAIVVNAKDADVIIGPSGLVIANSLLGEITAKMAVAIGKSKGHKVLLPINKCNTHIVGVDELTASDAILEAINYTLAIIKQA